MTATLLGQSAHYWAGDYSKANEFNPPFRWLLQCGPLAFVAGVIIITIAALFVFKYLNCKLSSSVLFLGTVAHFIGTSSWIFKIPYYGMILLIPLALFARLILDRDWDRFSMLLKETATSA